MSDFEHLDHYELLGVRRSASLDEIKRAYRREISKYHPDRFVNARQDEQDYARRRSQRLTEAYSVLGNAAARGDYDRDPSSGAGKHRAPPPSTSVQQRDHQAELYAQAQAHIDAGRLLQAIGALRQLQQINPFYRDSTRLLAAAEAQLNQHSTRAERRLPRWLLAIGGLVCSAALIGLAAWALSDRDVTTGGVANSPTMLVAVAPSRPPEPTIAPAQPTEVAATAPLSTATPRPTATPRATPTATPTLRPTVPPTVTAAPTPTLAPTTAPVAEEPGRVLLQDSFDSSSWATSNGASWQVGYRSGRYRVRGGAGSGAIWSYRTAPARNTSIGVDVQVAAGEGGLLVRFLNESNYVSITLNPAQTSFRMELHGGAAVNILAGGQSEAIAAGADATNRLVARLGGERIQVLVNGQLLATVAATGTPNSARYGLMVIAKDSPSEAFFDNLEIRAIAR